MTPLSVFNGIVSSRLSCSGRVWPPPRESFTAAFSSATRVLGKDPLRLSASEAAPLLAWGVDWPLTAWSIDEAARVTLLLEASECLMLRETVALAADLFRHGDNREKAAVLRALPFLPQPASFLPVAIDGARTNVLPVFEAIACESPYPATHFPDLNFNHLVLKAHFLEVPLGRIAGLARRRTPDLEQMAADWATECRAAGRSVSEDLAQLLPQPAEARS